MANKFQLYHIVYQLPAHCRNFHTHVIGPFRFRYCLVWKDLVYTELILAILINNCAFFLNTMIKDSQHFQYGKWLSSSDNTHGERFILKKPVFIYALFGNLNLGTFNPANWCASLLRVYCNAPSGQNKPNGRRDPELITKVDNNCQRTRQQNL